MPSEVSFKSKRERNKVDSLVKNKSMLSSNILSLSTRNAPKLIQLNKNTTCSTVVEGADDISMNDSTSFVEAFPAGVSAMEETIQQTTD